MDDRELLERAAKAAGLPVQWVPYRCVLVRLDRSEYVSGEARYPSWNPLADDGDALRLAVSLGLVVDCSRPSAGPPFCSHLHAEIGIEDWNAATRRAIVRAAAEIGRAARNGDAP